MMRRNVVVGSCLVGALAAFAACGESGESQNQGTGEDHTTLESNHARLLSTRADLPTCDDEVEGALFYVTENQTFYVCDSGSYVELDLSGPSGANGADGEDGIDGTNGTNGVDGEDGIDGIDGADGSSPLVATEPAGVNCAAGGLKIEFASQITYLCNGIDGAEGAAGDSCSVSDNLDGTATVSCGQGGAGGGTSVVISDGVDGIDGADGIDGTNGVDGVDGTSVQWLGSLDEIPSSPNLNEAFYWPEVGVALIYDGINWSIMATSSHFLGSLPAKPTSPETGESFYWEDVDLYCVYDGFDWNLAGTGTQGEATSCSIVRMFVSSTRQGGAFGGIATGDTVCQTLADNEGLGGTWEVWLSDSSTDASSRFSNMTDEIIAMDGGLLATDYADLIASYPDGGMKINEKGERNFSGSFDRAWTGTLKSGLRAPDNCSDWSVGTSAGDGMAGTVYGDARWTEGNVVKCYLALPIYCYED